MRTFDNQNRCKPPLGNAAKCARVTGCAGQPSTGLQKFRMAFLPIAERELRVATRKRSTIWLRVLAGVIALVIGSGFMAMSIATGTRISQLGSGLFGTLTWMAFLTTLAAGLFFTSDSLSEEKREGTLGFLFLTEFGGLDVVAGKLLATSLRGSYALLAVFPILAVTLLMGGVTGGQFWRTSLALINALFCSLAAGLLVSSVSRDAQRAMAGTFLLLVFLCAAGPLIDSVLTGLRSGSFRPLVSLTSPAYVFTAASAWGRSEYWQGLLTSDLLAWACLFLAGLLVRRTWQDRPSTTRSPVWVQTYAFKAGTPQGRARTRRQFLDPNPVVWLALRARWQTVALLGIAGAVLVCFSVLYLTVPSWAGPLWTQLNSVVVMGLYLWLTFQACRFLSDARRSGVMELLLVAPLGSNDIVDGHWRGLLRSFGLPVFILVLVQMAAVLLAETSGTGLATAGTGMRGLPWFFGVATALSGAVSLLANLVALSWVGLWMGLTSTNAGIATFKTLVFVQVLPWIGINIASALAAAALMFGTTFRSGMVTTTSSNTVMITFPAVYFGLSALLTLGKDAAWLFWARARLGRSFREEATRSNHSILQAPVAQPTLPLPPVIGN